MSEHTLNIISIVCSIIQIAGLVLIILWCFVKLPEYLKIFIGIAGIAAVVNAFLLAEKGTIHMIAGLAGLGLILFAIFSPAND